MLWPVFVSLTVVFQDQQKMLSKDMLLSNNHNAIYQQEVTAKQVLNTDSKDSTTTESFFHHFT